jgi:long-subunit fatty acid transport protein
MRKFLTFFAALFVTGSLLAGGLVTNTNQSAMFTRLQNRNASTGIDAVYFNPAGLTKLGNGFFASVNNQTIGQTKTVTNSYNYLTGAPKDYVGDVSAPIYPGVYVAYNTGKLSFSAGFNPIGGGGGAKYNKGLPSFETMIADIVPSLASQNIPTTQYDADIFFEGTSVYFGYQGNVGYKINDMISVAAGFRFVTAKNTYQGHMRNISVNPNYPAFGAAYNGSMVKASQFFTDGATFLTGLASGATAFVSGLQPIVTGGGGSVLLTNGASVGLSAAQIGQIQQLLGAAGLTPAQIGAINIATAQGTLNAAAPVFTAKASAMTTNAAATQDINVDAEQTGTGYTPIISANISPNDKLNISLRYEFQTKLRLTTKLNNNLGGGIFTEGDITKADMPALLAIGVEFKPIDKLMVSATFNTYFDKNVDYDGSDAVDVNMIDKNFLEYGLGAEYSLNEKLRISAGWVATSTGVNSNYQTDQRYSTNTNSIGAGFGYRITPKIDLNIGGQYTFYAEDSKDYNHMLGTNPVPVTETYNKKTWVVGIGLDFAFGKE